MKKYLFLSFWVTALLFSSSCKSTQQLPKSNRYFPEAFQKLGFGMSIEEAQKWHPNIKQTYSLMDFRVTAVEKNPTSEIKEVTYYFDNEKNKPLYELIIEYHKSSERDLTAQRLLGPPNAPEDEWRFPLKESYDGEAYSLIAWKFKNKLIIAATMKGTEWENK